MSHLEPSSVIAVLRTITDLLPHRFQRRRKLGPWQVLMLHLLALANDNRPGMKRLLERFVEQFQDRLDYDKPPTSGALSRARGKLTVDELKACIAQASDAASAARAKSASWRPNLRLIGIDCVRANLRRTQALIKAFHLPRYGDKPSHYPQLMLCTAWDLIAKMPIAWATLPGDGSERDGLKACLAQFKPNDVLVCDRNFPSAEIFTLIGSNAKFTMRMHAGSSAWLVIKQFIASGKTEDTVIHRVDKDSTITFRVVRKDLASGKPLVIATNLTAEELDADGVLDAYGKRWAIESAFAEFKNTYGFDRITAGTPEILEHEIAALMLFQIAVAETTALADAEIQRRDREAGDQGQLRWANRRLAGEICRILLAYVANETPEQFRQRYELKFSSLLRYPIRTRPGRTFPRVSKTLYSKWATKAARP